jgi:hypothetical protein
VQVHRARPRHGGEPREQQRVERVRERQRAAAVRRVAELARLAREERGLGVPLEAVRDVHRQQEREHELRVGHEDLRRARLADLGKVLVVLGDGEEDGFHHADHPVEAEAQLTEAAGARAGAQQRDGGLPEGGEQERGVRGVEEGLRGEGQGRDAGLEEVAAGARGHQQVAGGHEDDGRGRAGAQYVLQQCAARGDLVLDGGEGQGGDDQPEQPAWGTVA